ncbi:MAG TPA: hypothetical protein VF375_01620 [Candidatus Limnocylindrales bacterium]
MRLPAFFHRTPSDVDTLVWTDGDDTQAAGMLSAYAADSLSPDTETLSRMSVVVRAAFADSPVSRNAGLAPEAGSAGAAGLRGLVLGRGHRRTIASLCAVAVLTLSSVSFVGAQSNPGQPFYRLRLSLEGVRLPFEQPANPLQSNLDKADARFADIEREAAAKDWSAAADAAGAYGDVVASISLPTDAATKAGALQRLDAEMARLERLRLTSRAPETAALDKAIAAICGLLGIPVPTPPASATPPATNQGNGNGRDGSRATSTPSQGRDRDGSGGPKTTPGAGKSESSGRSNDPDGGHATPTPQDPDGSGHSSGELPRH